MKEEKRKVYYLFSPFLRIFHWIMVLSIVVLFVTMLAYQLGMVDGEKYKLALLTYIAAMTGAIYFKMK